MKQKGFTFIELLIAVTLIGVVVGIALNFVTAILRSSAKSAIFSQVKQNGDLAMEVMTRSIRGATDVCVNPFNFKSIALYQTKVNCSGITPTDNIIVFTCYPGGSGTNGFIDKTENINGGSASQSLTSNADPRLGVNLDYPSCSFAASNTIPKRVLIKFTLKQGAGAATSVENTVSVPFENEVTLRNF